MRFFGVEADDAPTNCASSGTSRALQKAGAGVRLCGQAILRVAQWCCGRNPWARHQAVIAKSQALRAKMKSEYAASKYWRLRTDRSY